MRECPECKNSYPEPFRFCPVDGNPLGALHAESASVKTKVTRYADEEVRISLGTLLRSLGILVLVGFVSFAVVFFYHYLKPEYGGLVVKTTPPGASIFVDGKKWGSSPLTVGNLRSGGHQIKAVREGYRDYVQQLEVIPYATENIHWTLVPLVSQLTNEQLAEIESWRKKLDNALKEGILLPPPDDYNALYFANKILAIDPANAHGLEVKAKLADTIRRSADVAYAREDWLEAEKQYKNLALLFPEDISINERLTDIAGKIDATLKDKEKRITEWTAKVEAAFKAGNLIPPEKDNALELLRDIQRLDKKNAYARDSMVRIREILQNRGDTRMSNGDYQAARTEYRQVMQYFPDDLYSKSRLEAAEAKLAESVVVEQQKIQRTQEEQQSRQRVANIRQSAINAYRSGSYDKAIAELREYLKHEPNSDEAYYFLGASYLEQKQLDTAILNFEKAVSLNSNHALSHFNLGLLYDRHRHDLVRATEHLKKAKDLGGVDKYNPERLQGMLQRLQERSQLDLMKQVPYAVEHKHAFSSCRGNLQITETGVEYKSVEASHSFYEAYSSLRVFSLQKDELSIRTHNNKKYNFRFLNQGDGDHVRRLASLHIPISNP